MLGGVTVNLVLAGFIYVGILSFWGEQYLPNAEVKYGITVDSLGYSMGLRNGDKVVSLDGKPVEEFYRHSETDHPRRGEGGDSSARQPADGRNTSGMGRQPADPAEDPGVHDRHGSRSWPTPLPRLPLPKTAGIMADDRIIGINDTLYPFFDEFRSALSGYKNRMANVMVIRVADTLRIPVKVPEQGLIGVYPKDPSNFLTFKEREYTVIFGHTGGFCPRIRECGGVPEIDQTALLPGEGLRVGRRIHQHRQHFSVGLGLAGILVAHRIPVHHACDPECSPDPCT